ncbi:hypothetical protein GCM10023213_28670 [Prosthecobacter algae]|uniref:5-methylcytosine-specific restriction enzyme subunit McrC n=1 Tax=Prosthecobacter algae TaxID=1144682 RepID=A0ABP9P913_9BACT
MVYTFQDCSTTRYGGKPLPLLLAAVDELNTALMKGEVPLVSLRGDPRPYAADLSDILTYTVQKAEAAGRAGYIITEACFSVSHFIGTYSTKIGGEVITLRLQPRWGSGMLSYLLQYTSGIYQPPNAAAPMQTERDGATWLLVMLWKSLFNQALRRCHIPKEYRVRKTNDRFFRSRLDVPRQIRDNAVDQSRFACLDAPLTMDTSISRTILQVIRLLSKAGAYPALMRDLAGYEERLAAFGVSAQVVRAEEIAKIRYTRFSIGYRPLMQASVALLRRFGGGHDRAESLLQDTPSYLIDLAELWENYLLAVLGRYLPARYRIFSPNHKGGEWLLEGERRQIRPDLLIEREGHVVAVLDAKFKNDTQVGRYEKDGVSREDLYQMSTYLYHYGRTDRSLLGLFITPVRGAPQGDVAALSRHPQHRLGVLTFDITGWDAAGLASASPALEQLRRAEATFAQKVLHALEG